MSVSALVPSFDDLHFWMICDFISASVLLKSHVAAIFFSRVTNWSGLSCGLFVCLFVVVV